MRRHAISIDQPGERAQNCANRFHRIRRRVHSDHGVAASEEEPLKRGQQNPANIIHGMIGLSADSQHSALAHRVPATRHVPDFGRGEDEVLVAHDFGNGRRDFGNDRPLELFQLFFARGVVENKFPEFAHGHALDSLKPLRVVGFQEQAADFVVGRIDQRLRGRFPRGRGRRACVSRPRVRAPSARRGPPIDRRTFPRWPWPASRADREIQIARAWISQRRIEYNVESSINRKGEKGRGIHPAGFDPNRGLHGSRATDHGPRITSHGISGARKRTRTSTPLRELAPEASASANSAIRACKRVLRGKLIVPARGSVCQRGAARVRCPHLLRSEAARTGRDGRGSLFDLLKS